MGAQLGQLPEELFVAAINHLSPRDIASARLVCLKSLGWSKRLGWRYPKYRYRPSGPAIEPKMML